ncbi:MAG: class I SAM-dependent RNA methyltransferase [Myxococcales bacterium]|nr:class I SAM-dependent RNA methyltransferase [Myxococcales bacterium]
MELEIHDLANTGEGVGRDTSGAAVFVSGALPRERVLVAIDERARSPRRATLLRVVSPSTDRIEPACPYVVQCGGCDLMHLAPATRFHWQERALLSTLASELRAVTPVPTPSRHAPTPALGYRNRARLRIEADGKRAKVGFSAPRSHRLAEIDHCVILEDALAPAIAELASLFSTSRGEGEARAALGIDRRRVYEVTFRGELDGTLFGRIERDFRGIAGARVWLEGATAPFTVGDPRCFVTGADGLPLTAPSGGFLQASEAGGSAIANAVNAAAGRVEHAVELFAGSGTFTILLARQAAQLLAIEADADAAAALKDNLRARSLANVRVREEDANSFAIPRNTELVVLDPPRAGAPGAMARIIVARARRVVYASCNPSTLGRDLATLARAGYTIDALALFDLFPQTSQLETIATLSLRSRAESRRDAAP